MRVEAALPARVYTGAPFAGNFPRLAGGGPVKLVQQRWVGHLLPRNPGGAIGVGDVIVAATIGRCAPAVDLSNPHDFTPPTRKREKATRRAPCQKAVEFKRTTLFFLTN